MHDVVEDCPGYDLERLWNELKPNRNITFGPFCGWLSTLEHVILVVRAVQALTKNPNRDEENYIQYLMRVAENPIARVVKMADLHHNLSDLDPKKDKNKIDKYKMALYILRNYHE
ncbi:MAG: hypothetical protein E6R03_13410 [Hyphomicrobiaceae bacterium]|nr:MAG: hypothetical protein E6R03_13410 [Hyphomicrobiaceae bacterium]